MDKTDKIIVIFYMVLAISFTSAILYVDSLFANVKFSEEQASQVNEITLVKKADVNKTRLFDVMGDMESYPLILPDNVISVNVVNRTGNVTYAEDEVMEKYIKTKLLVKQTLIPNTKQVLEIMDGDAQGTILTATFDQNNSETTLTTNVQLHFKGILAPFLFLPESVMEQELDGKINNFVDYATEFDDKYKKTVDDLYREILYRPADPQGLEYYSSMLKSGKMTADDIRQALLNSNEAKLVLNPSERKTPDELKPQTKDMINSLYNEVLYRPADPDGLTYYGSLFEAGKITEDDIRQALLNSSEAKLVLNPSERKTPDELKPETIEILNKIYNDTLGRPADPQGLSYYGSLLEAGKITQDDIRNALYYSDEGAATRIHTLPERQLDIISEEIFHRHVDQQTIDHYEPLLDSGNMTLDQVREELLQKNNG